MRQWAQFEIKEIPFKHTENLHIVHMVKYWNRLPRKVMGSPSFEIIKILLAKVLSNLL